MNDDIPKPPVDDPDSPLARYWKQPLYELVTAATRPSDGDELTKPLSDAEKERHRIYSLLVCALVAKYFNGNKRGMAGEYPWRPGQRQANGLYAGRGEKYLGHNIACVAVDAEGDIIDFDFNHNEIMNSSVEHAESRLVRRVFSLVRIYDGWATTEPGAAKTESNYGKTLKGVTIYTSLESCAQCAGIMALGTVKEVVYLQRDPGMYSIGNILRVLTTPNLRAPYPRPASDFAFDYFDRLNRAFGAFAEERKKIGSDPKARPFYVGEAYVDKSVSITSFLCTDVALGIFNEALAELTAYTCRHPDHTPAAGGRTNAEALVQARRFLAYAHECGFRGTPHTL